MPKDGKDETLVVRIAASKKEDDVGGRKKPPLREAKGTRAKHAGDARNSTKQHPEKQQPSPLPLGGRGLG